MSRLKGPCTLGVIPAPMSLAAHEPERCQPAEPDDQLVSRRVHVVKLQNALDEALASIYKATSDVKELRLELDRERKARQAVENRARRDRAELERLTRMLKRFVRESYMAGEAREKCEACEGSGLDVDHARSLYTNEHGDPVGGTELMSAKEIAALYRDDYGDECPPCTAGGCFEGRYIA